MSEQTDAEKIAHLDFPVALSCEYPEHGKWGSPLQPVEYMIEVSCSVKQCFSEDLLVCGPCFITQRDIFCRLCGYTQSPEQMMHFRGKV